MRRVEVFWHKGFEPIPVATLSEREDGLIAMTWDEQFLATPIELSPYNLTKKPGLVVMPRDPFNGLVGLFNDYVPDGFGRRLLRRAFERQGLTQTEITPLDMLQYIGERGMGALSFKPALYHGEKWAGKEVDLDQLQAAVEPILAGSPSAVIEEFIAGGTSPNGMRPKFLATEIAGNFYVGDSNQTNGTHWLIKFPAEIDPPEIAKIEYVYARMAVAAGLEVAEPQLFSTKNASYFATKRFDITKDARLHMHTLSGLLGVDSRNPSISYENLATLTKMICKPVIEIEKVFRLAAFNVYASNQDDHTKNVAFLMLPDGTWILAPAYDLTFNKTRYNEHKMTVNGLGMPKEADLLAFGSEIGIRPTRVKALNEEVKEGVSQFRKLAKELSISKGQVKMIATEIESKIIKKIRRARG